MGEMSYGRSLELMQELAQEYERQVRKYQNKEEELRHIKIRREGLNKELYEISSSWPSIENARKEQIENAEKIYSNECAEAKKALKLANESIDALEKEEQKLIEPIKAKFIELTKKLYDRVESAKEEISKNSDIVKKLKSEKEDIEQRIATLDSEEEKIKLCVEKLDLEYNKVAENTKFKNDRRRNLEEVEKKFDHMSPGKIRKVARKMNVGVYVSSPVESEGLPIGEIFLTVIGAIWLGLQAIFAGIVWVLSAIYAPIEMFNKFIYKLLYGALVSAGIIWLLVFVFNKFGAKIGIVLLVLLLILIAVFVGMILFNIIKFSNKKIRKEWNLEYFTVGYFFACKKNVILTKLAKEHYKKLNEKNPSELEKLVEEKCEKYNTFKEDNLKELKIREEKLEVSRATLSLMTEEYNQGKLENKNQCNIEIQRALNNLREECREKREKAQNECDNQIAVSLHKKENTIRQAEENEKETSERKKKEAEEKTKENDKLKDKQLELQNELEEISKKAKEAICSNNEIAVTYKENDIDIIGKRVDEQTGREKDIIPDSLIAGIVGKESSFRPSKTEKVYKLVNVPYNRKPIILICDVEDDESKEVTKAYYSFIDSLLGDMLRKTYIGAFRFDLVDSRGNKSEIRSCMELCGESFDELESTGQCVRICCDERTDKYFDTVIAEQEKQLDGKTIKELNNVKKNSDIMIRHIFLCMRIYSRKTGDFSINEFRRRINSASNCGIIPIVLMSKSFFDKNLNDLTGTIKEQCGNCYYELRIAPATGGNIRETNLKEEKLQ